MNKNLKKVIAAVLTISAVSAVGPYSITKNIGNEKVLAITHALEGIEVSKHDSSELKIYTNEKCTSYYEWDDDDRVPNTMYVKPGRGVSRLDLDLEEGTDWNIESIRDSRELYNDEDELDDAEDDGYRIDVEAESTIRILLENEEDDDEETYTIYIVDSDSEEDDNASVDNIYLTYRGSVLPLDFDPDKTNYDLHLKDEVSYLDVEVNPKDEDEDEIRINGKEVDEYDDWETSIDLDKGSNQIKIEVTDEEDRTQTYTINVTRGVGYTSNQTSVSTNNTYQNKWVQSGIYYRYYDSYGNMVKNQFFYDRTYGQTYYLGADGIMVTGWKQMGGQWYLFAANGALQKGWQYVGGKWYFMDSKGIMQTGWFKDYDGKWYYLDPYSGGMYANITIGGYKLGPSGAWIH